MISLHSVSAAAALVALVIGQMPGFVMGTDPGTLTGAPVAPIADYASKASSPSKLTIKVAPNSSGGSCGRNWDFG